MYFLEITSTLCFHRFKFSFVFWGVCVSKQQGAVGLRGKKGQFAVPFFCCLGFCAGLGLSVSSHLCLLGGGCMRKAFC